VQPVTKLTDLGETVMYFSGRTIDEAKQAAMNYRADMED
jgi:hypothetical protein